MANVRRAAAISIALVLCVAASAMAQEIAAQDARSERRISRGLEEIYRSDAYQRSLPGEDPFAADTAPKDAGGAGGAEPDRRLETPEPRAARPGDGVSEPPAARPSRQRASDSGTAAPSGGFVALGDALLMALCGAAVLALLFFAVRARRRSRREVELESAPPPVAGVRSAPAPAPRETVRSRAVALAAAEHLEEAVHMLLLDGLLRTTGRVVDAEAATSRELLGQVGLAPDRQAALEELVVAVEASLFGGRPVTADTWRGALAAHDVLTGGAWG